MYCPRWKPQQKTLWSEVHRETGFKIRDLFMDERRTEVGCRVEPHWLRKLAQPELVAGRWRGEGRRGGKAETCPDRKRSGGGWRTGTDGIQQGRMRLMRLSAPLARHSIKFKMHAKRVE